MVRVCFRTSCRARQAHAQQKPVEELLPPSISPSLAFPFSEGEDAEPAETGIHRCCSSWVRRGCVLVVVATH
jgi:hypothetical protein